MPQLTGSPRPVPLTAALVVKNGWKIEPISSGRMPTPESLIEIATRSPSSRVRTVMVQPGCWQASAALLSRLSSTCLIWSATASTGGRPEA